MDVPSTVRSVIADSLFLDVEEVQLQSNLMRDLGAESIDFLDIIFRLEQAFSIKIPKGEIEKKAREDLTDEEFAVAGVLQPKGLERLLQVMPELDRNLVKEGLKLRDIPSLYTVGTFVKLVEFHLDAKDSGEQRLHRPTASSEATASV